MKNEQSPPPVREGRKRKAKFQKADQSLEFEYLGKLCEKIRVWNPLLSDRLYYLSVWYGWKTALALMFPMETVFEHYAAACLWWHLDKEKYILRVQDTRYWLFDAPSQQFRLRPDLVIFDRSNGKPLAVLDTKWKCLSDSGNALSDSVCKNVSQGDIYQALAYQREYGTAWSALLYPGEKSGAVSLTSRNGNRLRIQLVDLWKPEKIAADVETLCGGSA